MSCVKFLKVTIYLQLLILVAALAAFAISIPYVKQVSQAPLNDGISEHPVRYSNAWLFAYGPFLPLLSVLRISVDIYLLQTKRFRPVLALITSAILFCLAWVVQCFTWWDCATLVPLDYCAQAYLIPDQLSWWIGTPEGVDGNLEQALLAFGTICVSGFFLYIPVTAVAVHVRRRSVAPLSTSNSSDTEKHTQTDCI